jgi:tripeptide aminopeptidase
MAAVPTPMRAPRESVVDRFLRYVRIDTQSREDQPQIPSTPGQWDLSRLLADELRALGASDVDLSPQALVTATVPETTSPSSRPTAVPVVGFIAHVDTSPAVSGANVTPIVHRRYEGDDIVLPADPSQIIRVVDHPVLRDLVGDDIITTDGTTLLGSDDKSGVAAIMTMVDVLLLNPQLRHGVVRVAFTPDEEIGVGVDAFDVPAFGAAAAYTVDGEVLGEISHETWGARLATVTFHGRSAHPGMAKGVMINAAYPLADFVAAFPRDMLPETTEGRVGFVHPYIGSLDVERSHVKVLLRDFDAKGLEAKEELVRQLATDAAGRHPGVHVHVEVREQYRNMNDVLVNHPDLVANAFEAARRAGLTPSTKPIRGGTDGARLTFKGLPCPNLFTGGHNFHSKLEFNSRRGLEKTTETLVHLAQVFAERAGV